MAKMAKKAAKKGKTTVVKPAKGVARAAAPRPAAKKTAAAAGEKYAQAGAPWWKQYLPR